MGCRACRTSTALPAEEETARALAEDTAPLLPPDPLTGLGLLAPHARYSALPATIRVAVIPGVWTTYWTAFEEEQPAARSRREGRPGLPRYTLSPSSSGSLPSSSATTGKRAPRLSATRCVLTSVSFS